MDMPAAARAKKPPRFSCIVPWGDGGRKGKTRMTAAEEHLMAWLRDVRAMEEQSETITRIKHYPHLKEKLQATLITSR